ncbi:MAG: hypothetical protein FVQ85_05125 [Planctomycetes bacterium]|nr:hypothetical protein [Planctomycetota bacterium]
MVGNINNNQVPEIVPNAKKGVGGAPDILKDSSSEQTEPSRNSANNQVDASLQVSYDSFIEKAQQIPPEDTDAVQRARELLLSGQLESLQNIREAAENIVNFGI